MENSCLHHNSHTANSGQVATLWGGPASEELSATKGGPDG